MVTAAHQKPSPRPRTGSSGNCSRLRRRSKNQINAPTSISTAARPSTTLMNRQENRRLKVVHQPAEAVAGTAMARPVK